MKVWGGSMPILPLDQIALALKRVRDQDFTERLQALNSAETKDVRVAVLARLFDGIVSINSKTPLIDSKSQSELAELYSTLRKDSPVKIEPDHPLGFDLTDASKEKVIEFRRHLIKISCQALLDKQGNLTPTIKDAFELHTAIAEMGEETVKHVTVQALTLAIPRLFQLTIGSSKEEQARNYFFDQLFNSPVNSVVHSLYAAPTPSPSTSPSSVTLGQATGTQGVMQKLKTQRPAAPGQVTICYYPERISGHVGGIAKYEEHNESRTAYLSYGGSYNKEHTVKSISLLKLKIMSELPATYKNDEFVLIKRSPSEGWQLFIPQIDEHGRIQRVNEVDPRAYFPESILPNKLPHQLSDVERQKIDTVMFNYSFHPTRHKKSDHARYGAAVIEIPLPPCDPVKLEAAVNRFLDKRPIDYSFARKNCAHAWLDCMRDAGYISEKQHKAERGYTGIVTPRQVAELSCKVALNYLNEQKNTLLRKAGQSLSSDFEPLEIFVDNKIKILEIKEKQALISGNNDLAKQCSLQAQQLAMTRGSLVDEVKQKLGFISDIKTEIMSMGLHKEFGALTELAEMNVLNLNPLVVYQLFNGVTSVLRNALRNEAKLTTAEAVAFQNFFEHWLGQANEIGVRAGTHSSSSHTTPRSNSMTPSSDEYQRSSPALQSDSDLPSSSADNQHGSATPSPSSGRLPRH